MSSGILDANQVASWVYQSVDIIWYPHIEILSLHLKIRQKQLMKQPDA